MTEVSTNPPAGASVSAPPVGYELARDLLGHEIYLDAEKARYERTLTKDRSVSTFERYADSGNRTHRSGGLPAEVRRTKSGVVTSEDWFVDGRRSRLDGPARIVNLEDGTVRYEWFLSGEEVMWVGSEWSVVLPDAEMTREVECSVFEPVLAAGADVGAIREALHRGVRTAEGMTALLDGAPLEWVMAFEAGAPRDPGSSR